MGGNTSSLSSVSSSLPIFLTPYAFLRAFFTTLNLLPSSSRGCPFAFFLALRFSFLPVLYRVIGEKDEGMQDSIAGAVQGEREPAGVLFS